MRGGGGGRGNPLLIHKTEISVKKKYNRVALSEVKQLLSIGVLTYEKKPILIVFLEPISGHFRYS